MTAAPTILETIREEIRAVPVSRKAVWQFGLLVGGVLLALALLLAWKQGRDVSAFARVLGGVGAVLVVLGAAVPDALRPAYRVWMGLAVVLGFFVSRILLAVLFFVAFTPMGLVMRLFGRDAMHRRPDPAAPSYWIARNGQPSSRERLEKYY